MPLIKTVKISDAAGWGLWEITESLTELKNQFSFKEELVSIDGLKNEQKKREKIAARLVLQDLLHQFGYAYEGMKPGLTGKPDLVNLPMNFSLSHSHNLASAIVGKVDKIGIDIELIQEKIRYIAFRVFNKEEIEWAGGSPEKLTLLWSMKEVLYKTNGERGIDFIQNLFILPFDYHPSGGEANGIIRTNLGDDTFNIQYFKHKNHIVAYNYQEN